MEISCSEIGLGELIVYRRRHWRVSEAGESKPIYGTAGLSPVQKQLPK